jgi:hypothetical protein
MSDTSNNRTIRLPIRAIEDTNTDITMTDATVISNDTATLGSSTATPAPDGDDDDDDIEEIPRRPELSNHEEFSRFQSSEQGRMNWTGINLAGSFVVRSYTMVTEPSDSDPGQTPTNPIQLRVMIPEPLVRESSDGGNASIDALMTQAAIILTMLGRGHPHPHRSSSGASGTSRNSRGGIHKRR